MNYNLNSIMPVTNWKISLVAALIPSFITFVIIGFSLKSFADYGIGIFILAPFLEGIISSLMKGYRKASFKECFSVMIIGLLFLCLNLIVFGIEGLMCIIMAAPVSFLSALVGCWIGFLIQKRKIESVLPLLLLGQIILLPSFISLESSINTKPQIFSVNTSVVVTATQQEVWNNLIEFKEIDSELPFIFRYGISYPIDSEVKGVGVGAIRYCNFSTGSFVEPIDVWDEPNHLHFYVEEQPIPMKELSPYDIDPKHLHGYFVSTKGEFKLTDLGNGKTKLEGTTWYYNKIKPELYWSFWTDFIIHSIHTRVLNHIKKEAEKKSTSATQSLKKPQWNDRLV